MKLIVAGTRHFVLDPNFIELCLRFHMIKDNVIEVVSGGGGGVDWAGEEFSIDYLDKEAKSFPADWTMGVGAGPTRNKKMADYGDALLLIWDGKSSGSADMKSHMLRLKKPIYEVVLKDPKVD